MDLAAQIRAANHKKASVVTAKVKGIFKDRPQDHPRLGNLKTSGEARTAAATARYRAVMLGQGWQTQSKIEKRLGCKPMAATNFLAALLAKKLIHKRVRMPTAINYRRTFEWCWVEIKV